MVVKSRDRKERVVDVGKQCGQPNPRARGLRRRNLIGQGPVRLEKSTEYDHEAVHNRNENVHFYCGLIAKTCELFPQKEPEICLSPPDFAPVKPPLRTHPKLIFISQYTQQFIHFNWTTRSGSCECIKKAFVLDAAVPSSEADERAAALALWSLTFSPSTTLRVRILLR